MEGFETLYKKREREELGARGRRWRSAPLSAGEEYQIGELKKEWKKKVGGV